MKITRYLILILVLLTRFFSFLNAQNTEGNDFWLIFGYNAGEEYYSTVDLYIRIVGGGEPTEGDIYFKASGSYHHFNILAHEV